MAGLSLLFCRKESHKQIPRNAAVRGGGNASFTHRSPHLAVQQWNSAGSVQKNGAV
jgi:hypothetical protein